MLANRISMISFFDFSLLPMPCNLTHCNNCILSEIDGITCSVSCVEDYRVAMLATKTSMGY